MSLKNWQIDPKIHMELQGTQNSQNNVEKEQHWRICTLNFKSYYKATEFQDSVILAQR